MMNVKNNTGIFIIIAIVMILSILGIAVYAQYAMLTLGLVVAGMLIILNIIKKNSVYYLFFFILLLTEFYYIMVFGGIARPYHFMQIIVFILLVRYMNRLASSTQFWLLLVITLYLLFSSLISINVTEALRSYILLVLNIGVAVVTALILCSEKISITAYKNTILIISLISVVWGLVQFGAKITTGINLALSETQIKQTSWYLIPSFRTEADTFSQYLSFPLMLYMPNLLHKKGANKWIISFYVMAILCLFINFVRTGIYGLVFGLFVVLLWSVRTRKTGRFLLVCSAIGIIVAIAFFLASKGFLSIGEYTQSKIMKVFKLSYSNIVSDYSGSYRIANIASVLRQTFSNTHNMFWGMGWGQTYYHYGGENVHLVVGDLFSFLGFGGIIGAALYLVLSIRTFFIFKKAASLGDDFEISSLGEGMMYVFSAVFVTSLFVGYLVAPEYWMILGIGFFMEWKTKKHLKEKLCISRQLEVRN